MTANDHEDDYAGVTVDQAVAIMGSLAPAVFDQLIDQAEYVLGWPGIPPAARVALTAAVGNLYAAKKLSQLTVAALRRTADTG